MTTGSSGVMAIFVRKLELLTVWKKYSVMGTDTSQALSDTMTAPRTPSSKLLQRISHGVRSERGM